MCRMWAGVPLHTLLICLLPHLKGYKRKLRQHMTLHYDYDNLFNKNSDKTQKQSVKKHLSTPDDSTTCRSTGTIWSHCFLWWCTAVSCPVISVRLRSGLESLRSGWVISTPWFIFIFQPFCFRLAGVPEMVAWQTDSQMAHSCKYTQIQCMTFTVFLQVRCECCPTVNVPLCF